MKLSSIVVLLACIQQLLLLVVANATDDPDDVVPSTRFCEKWSSHKHEYDLVAVTDDHNYGQGRAEDMALVRAFRKLGRTATRISIQDDDFDFRQNAKMIVIRSAWEKYEYLQDYQEFLEMANEHAILMNPLEVIQWQSRKDVYMEQLRQAGIHTPRTIRLTREDLLEREWNIEEIQQELDCEDILLKPALGNGGVSISRYPQEDYFFDTFRDILLSGDTALFQCFQHQISTKGERGIVLIGGDIVSHGIMKQAEEGSYMVNTDFGGEWSVYEPTPEEATFAKMVAAKVTEIVGTTPAYLRVDLINDNDDNLALMELAAGTADLWLSRAKPDAAELFAAYLDAQLRKREEECEAIMRAESERLE